MKAVFKRHFVMQKDKIFDTENPTWRDSQFLQALCNLWVGQKTEAKLILTKYGLFEKHSKEINFDRLQDIVIPNE